MKKLIGSFIALTLTFSLVPLGSNETLGGVIIESKTVASDKEYIEYTLNLANNKDQEWTYYEDTDAWALSIVSAVAYPELPNQQGVSVCVPGAYVTGIDTNGNGVADITSKTYTKSVKGSLVIDYNAKITSTNGQIYTASTAPVIINTGAPGYGSSMNSTASTTYAKDGYINIACGNRGKQDVAIDSDGNTYYTGDAPSCLVDQKAAARFVKYNILLGNLPGSVEHFVSTGGSGGGAHATMFAVTADSPDFYDYQIEAGAVGVYKNTNGTYTTTVTINGKNYELSDGAWGCIAYSPITSLYEADLALAFEYYMDTTYNFNTPFQTQLAEYLSSAYMEYINSQNLSVEEAEIGFDLNNDGDKNDTIKLTIEYDPEAYPETNGYYGSYLDLYLAEFTENLQWYISNLDYSSGWTWFDKNGNALSDEEVANMKLEDKVQAFLEGRYDKGRTGKMGRPTGEVTGFGDRELRNLEGVAINSGENASAEKEITNKNTSELINTNIPDNSANELIVGTPNEGTTQSANSSVDSKNYKTYEDMVESYKKDIEEIYAGDKYGNNVVSLYNPLNYINSDNSNNPTWAKIVMGASEGDISMFCSINLQVALLNAGVNAIVEWQWDGGHVPSEIFGNSLALYVDKMYGEYVEGANNKITKAPATLQTENGTATSPSGTDISSWINFENINNVSFSFSDILAYRTAGAKKAIPGFDVIDYGQEDYVFGNSNVDARHWNIFLLEIFEKYADKLAPLFNNK